MKLTDRERDEILLLAREMFGRCATVRLFRSRLDDDRTGGDIDLHIVAESADSATLGNELEFAAKLKDKIGDVQVDVIVRPPGYWPRGIDQVTLGTGAVLSPEGKAPGMKTVERNL
ncbi:hypothetical protein [Bradyrhizobium sp. F1.13.3]|uniref:hypothetical protein n=1 Tax=Bradyrhizobium sp. F1.13.3 TaxID=3156351 RepID=UPI0033944956